MRKLIFPKIVNREASGGWKNCPAFGILFLFFGSLVLGWLLGGWLSLTKGRGIVVGLRVVEQISLARNPLLGIGDDGYLILAAGHTPN